ncbi:pepsin/retropepsin-like aspartic protease family protein [Neolewinella antarctica]|uniref:Peptidase A2 domain-containing protein n=1 Tax=Neolewinella antarctica TaxID=442734 RepID=A0ABX0X6K1_9BACT|nr:pepsin/retropepsin-like aspartic protease family protein [Neolewinella antarctica]NJC24621.1 hypothetical protein [Neolewinella antarctica]
MLRLFINRRFRRSNFWLVILFAGVGFFALTRVQGKGGGEQNVDVKEPTHVANFLQTVETQRHVPYGNPLSEHLQHFDFRSRLICFSATVNGRPGNFILDTGAPHVMLNHRGALAPTTTGVGAGGAVPLTESFIESFVLTGQEHRKMWALSLDLRPLEARLNRKVDGFVGYELLHRSELRIDYPNRTFQLRNSDRHPRHEARKPDYILNFKLQGHLPVITVPTAGGKKLRLALDTGASANLLDGRLAGSTVPTGTQMNVQGLDGRPFTTDVVTLSGTDDVADLLSNSNFTLLDLSELGGRGVDGRVDGILGSTFLARFTVGIDYRRGRIYLWKPSNSVPTSPPLTLN